MKLIIVESPTKAKTISRFLDKGYFVESSFGHLRDLPKKKMGIDIENDFKPEYEISDKSKKRANELKRLAKKSDEIILASDEDREGEAIAWHLTQILEFGKKQETKNKKQKTNNIQHSISDDKLYKRIVFHEITKSAILEALKNPRGIDMNLVDAQQARRILDRLVGYELSPFLWKKIRYGLSAGRVQSVAVRLIVEREEEIRKFKPEEYWNIKSKVKPARIASSARQLDSSHGDGQNDAGGSQKSKLDGEFEARLIKINNKSIPKLGIKSKDEAKKIEKDLEKADYKVEKVTKKETKKNPLPPFTTSTLQQSANNGLGFSAKQTMMLAQQLYEGINLGDKGSTGLITYMRTDSLSLNKDALKSAEDYIKNKFGKEYAQQRFYRTKSKGAQEAHEAIRPTNPKRDPKSVEKYLDNRQYKLYKLIWERMVASQMASAVSDLTTIDVLAIPVRAQDFAPLQLRATGSVIKFEGFLKVYPMKSVENEDFHSLLPEVEEKENLDLIKVLTEQHFTQPPARYTEASLVKKLEEEGIGRPSTYAPTLSTIQDRGYVEKIERKFQPKEIGELVNKLLVEHFPKIVDLKFTAGMEEDLDEIAEGKIKWIPVVKDFYKPFKENLMKKEKEINKKDLTEEATDKKCEKCGSPMIIKLGRFGKFMACSNYPECKNTKQIGDDGKIEEPETTDEKCEKCGKPMVIKIGRYGKFLGCSGYPNCRNIKPIVKSTGVKCPECGKGEVVEKKSKKGRIFYACDQYPKCKFSLWNKPTGELCPKCESLMVFGAKGKTRCSNKECGFETDSK